MTFSVIKIWNSFRSIPFHTKGNVFHSFHHIALDILELKDAHTVISWLATVARVNVDL